VSRYQKGTTNLDFTEARDSEWQWNQLGRMQVCTSLQTGVGYIGVHRHRIDKYLDTLLGNQTARKALSPTTAKIRNRKMADCPSYY